jgi:hypothetical protein
MSRATWFTNFCKRSGERKLDRFAPLAPIRFETAQGAASHRVKLLKGGAGAPEPSEKKQRRIYQVIFDRGEK